MKNKYWYPEYPSLKQACLSKCHLKINFYCPKPSWQGFRPPKNKQMPIWTWTCLRLIGAPNDPGKRLDRPPFSMVLPLVTTKSVNLKNTFWRTKKDLTMFLMKVLSCAFLTKRKPVHLVPKWVALILLIWWTRNTATMSSTLKDPQTHQTIEPILWNWRSVSDFLRIVTKT